MAYITQYMEAYRSPHESPTGVGGVSNTTAILKMENKKLRDECTKVEKKNREMADEIIRLRQQLSYIRVAAKPKARPPPLDLSSLGPYQPSESRPALLRGASSTSFSPSLSSEGSKVE